MARALLAWGALALVAALAGGGALAWQGERAFDGSAAGSAQPEASEVEEGTLPASAARPVAPLWISAQEATYALSLQSTIESDTGEPLLSLRLRGIWQVQAVAQPDGLGLRAVLEEPSFAVEGAGPDAPAFDRAALLEALAQPVLWVERAPGRIEQIRGQRGLPGAARDLWYLAVSLVELVRPESPAPSWSTVEHDGMGRFRARYHFEPTGGALLKEKLVYTEPAGGRLGIGVAPE